MRTRASAKNGLPVTPQTEAAQFNLLGNGGRFTTANSQRAAVILPNPGAMDQGILTVGRFDSGYRAGIVAYQYSSKPYFKNFVGAMSI